MTAYPRSLVRSTAAPPERRQYRSATTLTMRAVDTLPAGVVGQVEGIALVYDVVDSFGTTFARGCIDRTARERVAAGKVRLFLDHGDMPSQGMYDTHLHIGVVRELVDEQGADGRWHARFRADLFDTEAGREAHEYLRAIAATGSETGVSIGMLKEPATTRAVIDGTPCHRIAEIALGEISITSMSSVPGTRVTAVRAAEAGGIEVPLDTMTVTVPAPARDEPINYFVLLDGIVAHLGLETVRAHLGATVGDTVGRTDNDAASGAPDSAASDAVAAGSLGVSPGGTEPLAPHVVPMEDRMAFLRTAFPRLYPP